MMGSEILKLLKNEFTENVHMEHVHVGREK
jgi:hypothetical protein